MIPGNCFYFINYAGNHEDFPVNSFDYFGNNTNYLMQGYTEILEDFLDA